MTRRGGCDTALIVFGTVVLIGATVVLASPDTPTPPAAATGATSGQIHGLFAPREESWSVLFIGDSYTVGSGLPEMSYACIAAVRVRWQCNLGAVPGTGYISGGPANRFVVNEYLGSTTSFTERIPELADEYQPDVVVFDGGRNDRFAPTADTFDAMVYTISQARHTWPDATVMFLRPRFLSNPLDDLGFDDNFMAELESDPETEGVLFLDPMAEAPFAVGDTSTLLGPDGVHPNPRGDRELGAALVASLRAHGVEGAP